MAIYQDENADSYTASPPHMHCNFDPVSRPDPFYTLTMRGENMWFNGIVNETLEGRKNIDRTGEKQGWKMEAAGRDVNMKQRKEKQ